MKTIWIAYGWCLLKDAHGRAFDYLKLKDLLTRLNGGDLYESYYLNGSPDPEDDDVNDFHTWLKYAPPRGPKMRVQLYRNSYVSCKCPQCNVLFSPRKQKGVDAGIVTLILKLAMQNQYDRLILSTGNGYFREAIDYVKNELHKEIWFTAFPDTLSPDLQSYADRVIWLNEHWQDFKKETHTDTVNIRLRPSSELIYRQKGWDPADSDTVEAMLAEQGNRRICFSIAADETFAVERGWEGWTVEPEDGGRRVPVISLDSNSPDADNKDDYQMPPGRYKFDGTDVKQVELFDNDGVIQ
jgi:uncharacterized LabA/DUF88 family protein